MEDFHDVLLLWNNIPGLHLPHVLLVRILLCGASPLPTIVCLHSMRYSRMLEESSFANRKADYFWLLLLSAIMLLVSAILLLFNAPLPLHTIHQALSPLVNLPFLSSPLAFVPIYLWSRRHPSTPISLFGLVTITAPYLPLALVGLAWLLNGTWRAAAGDLLGCAVGHVGWFMRDVWAREMVGGPTVFSDAPDAL